MPEAFNRASVSLTTTGITDVYQAPNIAATDRALIVGCIIANVDGTNPADITITIADSSNVAIAKIASTIAVPADSALEVIQGKLVLKRGEKLRATASSANRLEVTVSAVEVT